MVEVEDRLDTAQAAQEKLWDDAELRTKLAIAEIHYHDALQSLVQGSPGVLVLLQEHDALLRRFTQIKRAVDFPADSEARRPSIPR